MHKIGPERLTRLIDEHGSALVLYAQQWCDRPEDVVQEAFIRLMRQQPIPENVVAWLYRVVRNEAIGVSRANARRKRHESAAVHRGEPWFITNEADSIDASSAVAALQSLAVEQREAIVLRLWGGLTFEQIAQVVDTSLSTAQRRYEAGLRALRNHWSIPCHNQEARQ